MVGTQQAQWKYYSISFFGCIGGGGGYKRNWLIGGLKIRSEEEKEGGAKHKSVINTINKLY